MPSPSPTPVPPTLVAEYRSGDSPYLLADRYGLNASTIRRMLTRCGVELRGTGQNQHTPHLDLTLTHKAVRNRYGIVRWRPR